MVNAPTLAWPLYVSPFGGDSPMYGKRNCRNVLLQKLTNPVFLPVNFTSFEEHCNVSSRVDFALFCSVQLNQCHYLHDLVHPSIAHTTSLHMNCNPSHLTLAYLNWHPYQENFYYADVTQMLLILMLLFLPFVCYWVLAGSLIPLLTYF